MNVKEIFITLIIITLTCCKSNNQNQSKTFQKISDSSKSDKPTKILIPTLNFDSLADVDAYEKNNPTKFLKVTSDYIKNPLGQWLIKGKIKCSATMSDYSYVNLKLVYYFDHKRVLGTSEKMINDVFRSNTIKSFEFTLDTLPNADSIDVKLKSAVVHL